MTLEGVHHVLCTPFDRDGSIDVASLRRLTDTVIGLGVDGLTVLGVMGEAHKLTGAERSRVLDTVFEVNAGRVPVVVGASHNGTAVAVAAARDAVARGADAVMVAPPTFLGAGEALTEHLRQIANESGATIVLQDYPVATGVDLPLEAIVTLLEAVPAISCIKLEAPPTGSRSAALLARAGRPVTILGGLGGLYLMDELRHGTNGTMTGMAFPEVLRDIWVSWQAGKTDQAVAQHARVLPLLVADSQPSLGLSVRKHVWVRRGVIACPDIRSPGERLTPLDLQGLEQTMDIVGLKLTT